jgi:hypothetical protein
MQMRRLFLVAFAAVLLVPAAQAGGTRVPCLLVTSDDAGKALGGKAGKGKAQTLGLYKACTYQSGRKSLTVMIRQIQNKSDFDKSAKKNPPPVFQLPGIGDDAYSAGAGSTLLVWKKGNELVFTFVGVSPVVQTQKDLANAAMKRLP